LVGSTPFSTGFFVITLTGLEAGFIPLGGPESGGRPIKAVAEEENEGQSQKVVQHA
jgi:hypothetical protein